MQRGYTLLFCALQRLDTERSDTQSTFESSRLAIAPLSASSRHREPFLRHPALVPNGVPENPSNKNVLELEKMPHT
jgi:hypothetical protein